MHRTGMSIQICILEGLFGCAFKMAAVLGVDDVLMMC